MIRRPRTVAIFGADVRTREGLPEAVWWQSGVRTPLEGPPCATLAEELARRAATGAGVAPSGIRVFACGAGVDGDASALATLVNAYAAIRGSSCDIAVVVALDPTGEDGMVPSVALVLGPHVDNGDSKPGAPLAIIRMALAQSGSATRGDRFPLLLQVCARGAINTRSVTLLDVHAATADRSAAMLESLQIGFSRGAAVPSHCTVAPGLLSRSGAQSLAVVCAQVFALVHRVLPPFAGPSDTSVAAPWCSDRAPRPWIETTPRRSALWLDLPDGEAALVLEEAPAADRSDARPTSTWRQDLTLVSGADRDALATRLDALASGGTGDAASPHARWRAAIVASPEERAGKARRLAAAVRSVAQDVYHTPDGLFFGDTAVQDGKTVMLFPGQGAAYVGMFGDLCLDVPGVQQWFDELQDARLEPEPYPPTLLIAPPQRGLSPAHAAALKTAIDGLGSGALVTMTSSLAMFDVLTRAGVRAHAVSGYSNGENAALICAGLIDEHADIFSLMRIIRLHDENDSGNVRGRALAVNRAPRHALDEAIARAHGSVFVSLDNCPDQVVLFGDPDAIDEAAAHLAASGATCVRLSFEHGHHTPAFESCARQLRAAYADLDIARARLPIYSCATAAPYPTDRDLARDLAASQWAQCVRFRDTVERLYADGFRSFVEVGPGSMLTGFVRSTLKGRPHVAVPMNIAGKPGLDQVLSVLARLFVFGHDVRMDGLRSAAAPASRMTHIDSRDSSHEALTVPAPQGRMTERDRPALLITPSRRKAPTRPTPVAAFTPSAPAAMLAAARAAAPSPAATHGSATAVLAVEHFRLMQGFLDAQLRAHQQLFAVLARQPSAPRAAAECSSLVGDLISVTAERLESRLTLRTEDDLFLWHHAPGAPVERRGVPGHGLPIVPFCVSLEVVVQAAARLMHWSGPTFTVRQVRASRWLTLDKDSIELRIEAHVRVDDHGTSAVHVSIWNTVDAARPAFEAVVTNSATPARAMSITPRDRPALDAAEFNRRLFHGPLFRGVASILAGDEESISLEAVVPSEGEWSAREPSPSHFLPIGLLDVVCQTIGAWLAHCGERRFGVYPYQVDACEQFGPPPPPGTRTAIIGRIRRVGSVATADIDVCLPDGSLMSRVTGLSAKIFNMADPFYSYVFNHGEASRLSESVGPGRRRLVPPSDIVLGDARQLWLRVLGRIALAPHESRDWTAVGDAGSAAWLLDRIVVKEVALDVLAAAGVAVFPNTLATTHDGSAFIVTGSDTAADFRVLVSIESTAAGPLAALVSEGAPPSVTLAERAGAEAT